MAEAPDARPASVIFMYGPPGVGKLTVAREVTALTGYRLFDNHVSIDWARTVFPFSADGGFGESPFARLRDRLRLAVFEEAAQAGIGIVFTYVYAAGADNAYVRQIGETVETHGGRICFVRLSCDRDVHAARVTSAGRHEAGKLATPEGLSDAMATYDLTASVPARESLLIDTTFVPAAEAARRIVAHYQLK